MGNEDFVTNEEIWLEFVTVSDGVQEEFALFVFEQVARNLGVPEKRVLEIVGMMLDDSWRPFLVNLVFPFERAQAAIDNGEVEYEEKGGYVYILHESSTNKYKIGISKDYVNRISAINSNLPPPMKVELVTVFHADNPQEAEKMLHDMYEFSGQRVEREWFELSDNDVKMLRGIKLYRRNHFISSNPEGSRSWSWHNVYAKKYVGRNVYIMEDQEDAVG